MGELKITFTIEGDPVGKPRQTQRDKWRARPNVARYRAWADIARLSAPRLPEMPCRIVATAFMPLPASLSRRLKVQMKGKPHRVRPDADNILKAICDSLFANDAVIYDKHIMKFWDDGRGARVEVSIY